MLLAVCGLFALGGEPYSIDGMASQLRADGWHMVTRRRVSKIVRGLVRSGYVVRFGSESHPLYALAGGR